MPGIADVLDVGVGAGDLRRDVDPRERLADDLVLADRLRDALTRRRRASCAPLSVGIVKLNSLPPIRSPYLTVLPPPRDDARRRRSGSRPGHRAASTPGRAASASHTQPPRGSCVERLEMPPSCRCRRPWRCSHVSGVRVDHLVHVHVQLFGDEHQDAGRGAVTELRLAVRDDDRVVGVIVIHESTCVEVRQEVAAGRAGERREAVRRRRLAGAARAPRSRRSARRRP